MYEAVSLPVAYHPLLWLTRERIMESREMVCDQMAAETAGRNEYARFAACGWRPLMVEECYGISPPHAIGIFDANVFERRLLEADWESQ